MRAQKITNNNQSLSNTFLYVLVFRTRKISLVVLLLLMSFLLQPIYQAQASEDVVDDLSQETQNENVTIEIEEDVTADTSEARSENSEEEIVVDEEVGEIEDLPEIDKSIKDLNETPAETGFAKEIEVTKATTSKPNASEELDLVVDSEEVSLTTESEIETTKSTSTESLNEDESVAKENQTASSSLVINKATSSSATSSEVTENQDETTTTSTSENMNNSESSADNETDEETGIEKEKIQEDNSEGNHGHNNSDDEINLEDNNEDKKVLGVATSTLKSTSTENQSEETLATTSKLVTSGHNSHPYQFSNAECTAVGDGSFYCNNKKDSLPELLQDGVYSTSDSDGYLEIFIRVDGVEQQLTNNTIDDSAPYYDALSDRIVWHAINNDRYQIMSYDMKTKTTKQITDENYNNMEPMAYGDLVLWQAWIVNNWEIMLYDGKEIKQLTHNIIHDVAPNMREGYIVWQSQFVDGWKVAVYDETTEQIEYVDAEMGTKVENPRFVLVYDSTDVNGDITTFGYDPRNKESFVLGQVPVELPDELPEPDQTGEIRALIQNKSGYEDAGVVEIDNDNPPNDAPEPELNTATSTSVDNIEENVSGVTETEDLETPLVTVLTEILKDDVSQISDLVIPSATSSYETQSEVVETTVGQETDTTIDSTPQLENNEDFKEVIPPTASSTLL